MKNRFTMDRARCGICLRLRYKRFLIDTQQGWACKEKQQCYSLWKIKVESTMGFRKVKDLINQSDKYKNILGNENTFNSKKKI